MYMKNQESKSLSSILDQYQAGERGLPMYDELRAIASAPASAAPAVAQPMPMDPFDGYPEYNTTAMGCGLEDRGITDRYDAMYYGWSEAIERVAESINNHFSASDATQPADPTAQPDPNLAAAMATTYEALIAQGRTGAEAMQAAGLQWKLAATPIPLPSEPVEYQFRTRPDWDKYWSIWERCTKEQYDGYVAATSAHDWHYEFRALGIIAIKTEQGNQGERG